MFMSCRWVYRSVIKIDNLVNRNSSFPAKHYFLRLFGVIWRFCMWRFIQGGSRSSQIIISLWKNEHSLHKFQKLIVVKFRCTYFSEHHWMAISIRQVLKYKNKNQFDEMREGFKISSSDMKTWWKYSSILYHNVLFALKIEELF